MNRAQLEHVIRAAAAIAGDDEIVVIGSQGPGAAFSNSSSVRMPAMPFDDDEFQLGTGCPRHAHIHFTTPNMNTEK